MNKTLRLLVSNRCSEEVTFRLEPWAEEYQMANGVTFEVVARGPEEPNTDMEVEISDGEVTVYAWPGATAQVYEQGVQISSKAAETLPGPPLPGQEGPWTGPDWQSQSNGDM